MKVPAAVNELQSCGARHFLPLGLKVAWLEDSDHRSPRIRFLLQSLDDPFYLIDRVSEFTSPHQSGTIRFLNRAGGTHGRIIVKVKAYEIQVGASAHIPAKLSER